MMILLTRIRCTWWWCWWWCSKNILMLKIIHWWCAFSRQQTRRGEGKSSHWKQIWNLCVKHWGYSSGTNYYADQTKTYLPKVWVDTSFVTFSYQTWILSIVNQCLLLQFVSLFHREIHLNIILDYQFIPTH